jgi:G6PDH family F420-dependent oxidoreductase
VVRIGYTQMCEQRGPKDLVRDVEVAEQAGFAFSVVSDHFHPWLEQQGHSPYAWAVLGASVVRTSVIELMTYVTCPIMRYHPAVVAQKAATVAVLADGRFRLGLGAGEALNEHVIGRGWPSADVRHGMLREAIEIIRALWTGRYVTYHGRHFAVDSARLFDLPDRRIPLGVAVSGTASCRLAGELADLVIAVQPEARLVELFREFGGAGKPGVAQLPVCYGPDAAKALTFAHDQFRWSAAGWKVQAELPAPVNFDAYSRFVREEDIASMIPHGPDPEPFVQGVRRFVDAGFSEVAFLQIGPDQDSFCDFYARTLKPALAEL